MANQPAITVDPVRDSIKYLLAVVFLKSSSNSYPYAVNIAQNAFKYQVIELGNKPLHMCVFDTEGVSRALALLELIKNWRGTQVFADGELLQDNYQITGVLRCYLKATKAKDRKAHCHTVIPSPFREDNDSIFEGDKLTIDIVLTRARHRTEYIFPCRYLEGYVRFSDNHPSDKHDIIHSAAVIRGCHICPFFDEKAFKKL